MASTLALLASLGAGQAFLESRDEIAAAEQDLCILGAAAFEWLAVERALKVDDQPVAFSRGAILRLEARIGVAQALERLVDVLGVTAATGFSTSILAKSARSNLGSTSKYIV